MSNLTILCSLLFIIIVSGAPVSEEQSPTEDKKTYIIKFKNDFDASSSRIKISKHMMDFKLGAKVKWVYRKVFNGIALEGVTRDALEWLQKQDYIEYIEESVQFRSTCTISTGTAFTQTSSYRNWGLDRITEVTYTSESYDFSPSAHGDGATIYIVDSGVRTTHQEFDSNRASTIFSAFSDSSDIYGHGTSVAGVAAGYDLGTANKALIKSVKVLDSTGNGNADNIIAGLDYIKENGTSAASESVINMSFASEVDCTSLGETISQMSSAGYVLVAAAGNIGSDVSHYPAAYDGVISVGAINAKGKKACFSNYGSTVDIYAPGSSIHTADNDGNNKMIKVWGTSFAAPFVSGVAAMMIEEIKDGTLTLASGTSIKDQIISDATTTVPIVNLPAGSNNRILFCD